MQVKAVSPQPVPPKMHSFGDRTFVKPSLMMPPDSRRLMQPVEPVSPPNFVWSSISGSSTPSKASGSQVNPLLGTSPRNDTFAPSGAKTDGPSRRSFPRTALSSSVTLSRTSTAAAGKAVSSGAALSNSMPAKVLSSSLSPHAVLQPQSMVADPRGYAVAPINPMGLSPLAKTGKAGVPAVQPAKIASLPSAALPVHDKFGTSLSGVRYLHTTSVPQNSQRAVSPTAASSSVRLTQSDSSWKASEAAARGAAAQMRAAANGAKAAENAANAFGADSEEVKQMQQEVDDIVHQVLGRVGSTEPGTALGDMQTLQRKRPTSAPRSPQLTSPTSPTSKVWLSGPKSPVLKAPTSFPFSTEALGTSPQLMSPPSPPKRPSPPGTLATLPQRMGQSPFEGDRSPTRTLRQSLSDDDRVPELEQAAPLANAVVEAQPTSALVRGENEEPDIVGDTAFETPAPDVAAPLRPEVPLADPVAEENAEELAVVSNAAFEPPAADASKTLVADEPRPDTITRKNDAEAAPPAKKKGVAALLKGLRSGEVSAIVDKMEEPRVISNAAFEPPAADAARTLVADEPRSEPAARENDAVEPTVISNVAFEPPAADAARTLVANEPWSEPAARVNDAEERAALSNAAFEVPVADALRTPLAVEPWSNPAPREADAEEPDKTPETGTAEAASNAVAEDIKPATVSREAVKDAHTESRDTADASKKTHLSIFDVGREEQFKEVYETVIADREARGRAKLGVADSVPTPEDLEDAEEEAVDKENLKAFKDRMLRSRRFILAAYGIEADQEDDARRRSLGPRKPSVKSIRSEQTDGNEIQDPTQTAAWKDAGDELSRRIKDYVTIVKFTWGSDVSGVQMFRTVTEEAITRHRRREMCHKALIFLGVVVTIAILALEIQALETGDEPMPLYATVKKLCIAAVPTRLSASMHWRGDMAPLEDGIEHSRSSAHRHAIYFGQKLHRFVLCLCICGGVLSGVSVTALAWCRRRRGRDLPGSVREPLLLDL